MSQEGPQSTAGKSVVPFLLIPRHMDDDRALSPNEFMLLAIFQNYVKKWGEDCSKTQKQLAKITGLDPKTIENNTRRLKDKKRIHVSRHASNHVRPIPYTDDPDEKLCIIPNELFSGGIGLIHKKLIKEFRVYAHITHRCGKGGVCWEAISTIAEKTGVGEDRVRKALQLLELKELIHRRFRQRKTTEIRVAPLQSRIQYSNAEFEKAAEKMLNIWPKTKLSNGGLREESVQAVVNACKHAIIEEKTTLEYLKDRVQYFANSELSKRTHLSAFIHTAFFLGCSIPSHPLDEETERELERLLCCHDA